MLRTLLARVLPESDGRDETDSDRDDGTGSAFAGSRLDASVVHAHGGDVTLEDDADAELESRARAAERERWRE